MAKAKLSDEVKTFIVQALACFDTPSAVAEAVKQEFKIDVSKQLVETHDPTKRCAKGLARKWTEIFEVTREVFIDKTATIPIAYRSVRLRAIGRMAAAAERQKNYALAAQLLEQAAKEVGDAYTNKRQLSGPRAGPIKSVTTPEVRVTEEDLELARKFLRR